MQKAIFYTISLTMIIIGLSIFVGNTQSEELKICEQKFSKKTCYHTLYR